MIFLLSTGFFTPEQSSAIAIVIVHLVCGFEPVALAWLMFKAHQIRESQKRFHQRESDKERERLAAQTGTDTPTTETTANEHLPL